MQFNSYEFIFSFLPLSVLIYYLANRIRPIAGKIVLIVSSIIFYSYGRINMLIYLGISIAINYAFAFIIRKRHPKSRIILALPIIINAIILFYFKYFNFTINNLNGILGTGFEFDSIVLPLGISFYTFQQIAYIVAIERNELESADFIDYLTYILFYPKLLMGPIIEPVDFINQINEPDRKKADLNNIVIGIKLFSLGLFKKVLIADTFARAVSWVYSNLDSATAADCLLLTLFYTFEIYFDFSGYSDMAIGVGSMLNIDLPMNFDSPYKAISIRDFWGRWHISLTKFLTKYIYIPLGGSRKGILMTCVNTLIVFLISGLWHGDNWTFILWGLLHGLLSCFDRLFDKVQNKIIKPVRWMFTFIAVNILWLLFSAQSVTQWKEILLRIISFRNTAISDGLLEKFELVEAPFLINTLHLEQIVADFPAIHLILFLMVASIICFIPKNNYRTKSKLNAFSLILASASFVWGVISMGTESVFLYFGF